MWFSVPISRVFPPVLHSFAIRHLTLSVSRMMYPTMSFMGFWENDADVSMFWVRPVECSLKHVTLWDAARAVRTMCLLRAQCRLSGAHAVGSLTKKSTWPDPHGTKVPAESHHFHFYNRYCTLKSLFFMRSAPFIVGLSSLRMMVVLHLKNCDIFLCTWLLVFGLMIRRSCIFY